MRAGVGRNESRLASSPEAKASPKTPRAKLREGHDGTGCGTAQIHASLLEGINPTSVDAQKGR